MGVTKSKVKVCRGSLGSGSSASKAASSQKMPPLTK